MQNKIAIIKTSKGPGAGTVAYKAPEMFMDSKCSTPVDIYSFGCVVIEMFTGKRLFEFAFGCLPYLREKGMVRF